YRVDRSWRRLRTMAWMGPRGALDGRAYVRLVQSANSERSAVHEAWCRICNDWAQLFCAGPSLVLRNRRNGSLTIPSGSRERRLLDESGRIPRNPSSPEPVSALSNWRRESAASQRSEGCRANLRHFV